MSSRSTASKAADITQDILEQIKRILCSGHEPKFILMGKAEYDILTHVLGYGFIEKFSGYEVVLDLKRKESVQVLCDGPTERCKDD